MEMARQRDHRKLGRELDLFSFHDEGPGFPFFHPKGMRVINALLEYWRREHVAAGYEEIRTPIMLERTLWERSGHWDNYKDNMYFTAIDEVDFAVKPMNCPGGILVYKTDQHSYRDFPLRMAELGLVHRHEMSGVLHGLFRVRVFTQDDAHIYCLPEQVEDEVVGVIDLVRRMYKTFGFERVHVELSTRPDKSIGSDEMWQTAESCPGRRARARRALLHAQSGRRRVLRPQDRLPRRGRDGPHLAVRHLPARLRHARAPRSRVRR